MWHDYYTVTSLAEAAQILAERGGRARIVAGGTGLLLELEGGGRRGIDTLIINGYATLSDLRRYITPPGQLLNEDAADDDVMEQLIETASRRIDDLTGRVFYPFIETHKYDVPSDDTLWFDADLLAVTISRMGMMTPYQAQITYLSLITLTLNIACSCATYPRRFGRVTAPPNPASRSSTCCHGGGITKIMRPAPGVKSGRYRPPGTARQR